MKHIESRANPWYKAMKQSVRSSATDGVWLEGVHLCQEYLRRVGLPTWAVFDAGCLRDSGHELVALQRAVPESCQVVLAAGLLEGLSAIAGAQGVAFWAPVPTPALPAVFREDCLILDRVQDPGNVGSILRSCAAVGIRQVIALAGGASLWSAKVLRAGQGAHFALELFDRCEAETVAARLRVPLAVTALEQGRDLYAYDWHQPVAWLMGHEGQGAAPEWLDRAERRVFIPQADGVESLNVAAAAAVCLFEQRRQRLSAR